MIPTLPACLAAVFALALLALPALAAPAAYVLEPAKSSVTFETDFGRDRIRGRMPVSSADLTLDFDAVQNSRIDVTLNAAAAEAGLPFVAEAMKSPQVLDTAAHPTIRFQSTRVRPRGGGASVEGKLTIRGVTRPVTLAAELYRQQGSAEGDLSHMTVRLTGSLRRSDYGAVGWNDMVGDVVRLDILARIARVD